jgi:hypothetical protein
LKRVLDEMAHNKKGLLILLNSDDQKWTENGSRSSFGKARDKAGLRDCGLTIRAARPLRGWQ